MTPKKYRAILDANHTSQVRMAEILGISSRSSQGYALGETAIPTPTAILLWCLDAGMITVRDLEKFRDVK